MHVQEEQQHDLDHMQMIKFKGKRTKRQRLPSPIRLTMSSTSWTNNSEEEEDLANCLILLAQGRHNHQTQKVSEPYHTTTPDHNNKNVSKKIGLYVYECKTCNRCFPSFQALGGHSVSHKKPKANIAQDQKQGVVTSFVNGGDDDDNYDPTTLTLQIPNNRTSITKSNKVHECSICGAEYTSGQALGGHMRRHRTILNTTSSTTTTNYSMSGANNIGVGDSPNESIEVKRPRHVLKLDLNLPAPEDDQREPKLPFKPKEKVIVFNATSLVNCHY
ncbi:PREDICTED: zinc finger protein ZAT5 isoform X2 [Lupinus angustifolius]|uniref:zinc finger protein ZAT5 isoform X2 n=1 Tax=Lupinus angustifolius TaxID=3871 RepID=UPI00092FD6E5|nr:PREDICTED: zinc finger protein ZAT5 isoform X2 [Lupinus angustifolius]